MFAKLFGVKAPFFLTFDLDTSHTIPKFLGLMSELDLAFNNVKPKDWFFVLA